MARWPDAVNFTSFEAQITYVNGLTQGWTMTLFALALYVIIFSYMYRRGNELMESLAASTYLMVIMMVPLYIMRWISLGTVSFFIVWTGIVILLFVNRKE